MKVWDAEYQNKDTQVDEAFRINPGSDRPFV